MLRRKIRIAIADDHKVLREGLVALFKLQDEIRVLYSVSNGAELLEKIKAEPKPDVVLLDIEMPCVDGREALQRICEKYKGVKVIMLSMHTSLDYIQECISLGACGFLPKDCDFEKILDAISSVVYKGFYFDEVVSRSLVASARKQAAPPVVTNEHPLDTMDIEVIQLICQGKLSKEIADTLCRSERTIEGRRQRIASKTGTQNLVELVVYAIKHGIYKID